MNEQREELLKNIETLLKDTGRARIDDKITWGYIERADSIGDKVIVGVYLTKKRCRKPSAGWELYIDIVRDLVFWEKSTYTVL